MYIEPRKKRIRVIGYYFQSRVEDCKRRNEQRPVEQIPLRGILGRGRTQIPSKEEGFAELYYVRINESNQFVVKEWKDEV